MSDLIQEQNTLGYARIIGNRELSKNPKLDNECSSYRKCNWIEFDEVQYCQNFVEVFFNKQKHQIDKNS